MVANAARSTLLRAMLAIMPVLTCVTRGHFLCMWHKGVAGVNCDD